MSVGALREITEKSRETKETQKQSILSSHINSSCVSLDSIIALLHGIDKPKENNQ